MIDLSVLVQYVNNISPLEEKLGIIFSNKDLLTQALTHRSYLNENPDFPLGHNERLEFLGDAVLELIVTEELYKRFPDKPEGDLTSFRAALVNSNMLAYLTKISKRMGVTKSTFIRNLIEEYRKKNP